MRQTKCDKLLAFYEHFVSLLDGIPDGEVQSFCTHTKECITKVRDWLADPSTGLKKAEVAAGLEQGLRETPEWILKISPEWREQARQAMTMALRAEYPDFYSKDRKKLDKVIKRGKALTEAEYYLVRYEIDCLEGEAARRQELEALYGLLVDF